MRSLLAMILLTPLFGCVPSQEFLQEEEPWPDKTLCEIVPDGGSLVLHRGYYSELVQYKSVEACSNGVSWLALSSSSFGEHFENSYGCAFKEKVFLLNDHGEFFQLPKGNASRPDFLKQVCTQTLYNRKFGIGCYRDCDSCSFNPITFGSHKAEKGGVFDKYGIAYIDYSTGRYIDVTTGDGELCRYEAFQHSYDYVVNIMDSHEAPYQLDWPWGAEEIVDHFRKGMFTRYGGWLSHLTEDYQNRYFKALENKNWPLVLEISDIGAQERYKSECPPGVCCVLDVLPLVFDD